jgi:2-isopropylmalate synthase
MKNKIIVFDTTLRDGEQCPGASLNIHEKLEIARQLEKLRIDVIEAGFPVSSPTQFEAVKRIAGEVNLIIAALARAKELDIKKAAEAIKEAPRKRIHTFSSTSDFHILGKFGHQRYGQTLTEKRKTIIKMSEEAVQYARTFCDDVEFSAEDAGRTDIAYLIVMMIWVSPLPILWQRLKKVRARLNVRSTVSANGQVMPLWKKSSWPWRSAMI